MSDKRILVIDDEQNVVSSIVEKLEKEGFVAQGVGDGVQAIDLYKAERFDLVLTDLKLPGMDGIEILQAIMEYDPEALVVMITAYGTVDIAVEALKSGAQEFITKPFDLNALVAKLRSILEQRSESAVRGNLRDLGLASIISVNCNEMNEAQLVIRRQGQLAEIYFEDGTIAHATLGDQEGEEVIYELLGWQDGSFSLEQGIPPPKHTIMVDWTGLLLKGMHRLDEDTPDSELEWDEDEALVEAKMDRVARALTTVKGIDGVVVCSQGGELLGQATNANPAQRATLTAFIGHRAETLGNLLDVGESQHVALAGEGPGTMVVPYQQNYVGLFLAERTSTESTAQEIQTVLRRYQ
jgi:DNA-binding response OmpR family regulator